MAIKQLISKTSRWFSSKGQSLYEPLRKGPVEQNAELLVHPPQVSERTEAVAMIQDSFDKLIEKLGGINDHLGQQMNQNQELMDRIDQLPQLLQHFPESMNNQKQMVDSLVEQLKSQALKSQQFTNAVEKIPVAAQKQTEALSEMSVQLAAGADVDAQLAEGFRKFNNITEQLKDNVEGQTDSIIQLSRTFSANDRYLKYILNTQHKRFMWVFITAMAVCTFAIIVLGIVIILLK